MLFENIAVLAEDGHVLENRFVAVRDRHIVHVGDAPPEGDFGRVYDGKGKLLASAFYNAHAHSPMTLLRGYGENLRLQEWLSERIFPFEDKLDGEAVYWGTLLAMAESMRFGIVSSTDMYNFCDDIARAVLESGMKANLGRPVLAFSDDDPGTEARFDEAKKLYAAYNGAGDGRLVIDMSLHAEYTSTAKTAARLADYTREIGAGMHVHVSETESETEDCKARRGKTPVAYLNELGLFDTRTTAAHCVWLTEADMDIMAEKGVTAASCPVSNMKLSSGVCDVPALLARGVNVALGTDGVASNNNLNFFEEMKFFALGNKLARRDPTLVTPAETLRAATSAGAKAQGRTDCGAVAAGKRADIIVIDLSAPNMRPVHDLANNLVYAASGGDVLLTAADGQILYENGEYKTLDMEKIVFEAERATARILGELNA